MKKRTGTGSTEILGQELRRWGIDSKTNLSHKEFADSMQSYLREVLDGLSVPIAADMPVLLPYKKDEAIEQVFDEEIEYLIMKNEEKGLLVCHDQLLRSHINAKISSWAPFALDRATKSYEIIPELQELGVKKEELDPLLRFNFVYENCRDTLWNHFIEGKSCTYTYLRALVYFHACHHAKCITCGKESIRYNVLNELVASRCWNRLTCVECESVYEIKTVKDSNAMRKKITNNRFGINGGSFLDIYYAIRSTLPSKAKMYIALVPIEFSEHEKFRDVVVAEIDFVTPQIKNRSFPQESLSKKRIKIYSTIHPQQGTSCKWFDIPIDDMDCINIAKKSLAKF